MAGLAISALLALLGLTFPQDTADALERWEAYETWELAAALKSHELDEAALREVIELAEPAAPLSHRAATALLRALRDLSRRLAADPATTAERIELLERGRAAVARNDMGYAAALAIEEAPILDEQRAREVLLDALAGLPDELADPASPLDRPTAAWALFTGLQKLTPLIDDDPATTTAHIERLERGRKAVAPLDAGYAAGLAITEARLLNATGHDGRSREILLQALAALPEEDSWRAWVLRQLGEQARFRRDLTEARAWLEAAGEACDRARYRGHRRLEAMILVSHASVLLDMGLSDLAAPVLDDAGLALARTQDAWAAGEEDREPVYTAFEYECARVAQKLILGRETEAISLGNAALERFAGREEEGLGSLRERVRCLVGVGELRSGSAAAAEAAFTHVLASPVAESWDLAMAGVWLAHLRLEAGDTTHARKLLAAVRTRIDALEAQPGSRAPGKELGVVAALELQLALRTGGPEAVRERLPALERAFETMVEDWRAAPRRAGGLAFLRSHSARLVVSVLLEAIFLTDGSKAAFDRALGHLHDAQATGTLVTDLSGGRPLPPFDPSNLPAGVGVLVYFRGTDRTHVFGFHRDVSMHFGRPGDDARYSEFTRLVATPPDARGPDQRAELDTLGTELRDELVPDPLLDLVSRCEVVAIVGRDMLGDLPFEALPGRDGVPLGVELALEHWYSLPLGCLLARSHEAPRDGPACLVVAPRHGPFVREGWPWLRPLPLGEDEYGNIAASLLPRPVRVLGGEEATLAGVRAALGNEAELRVLHFLTHGVTAADRERPAALVLSGQGGTEELLFSEEVERWHAPPLVVLSACASGSGPTRSGDAGAAHLGGAFLRAGARAVVLSEFALPYAATLDLVSPFQAELAAGASPAEALRRARRAVYAAPGGDDPYRFALLHVVGAGHEPVYPPPPVPSVGVWVWLAGGACALALVVFRRRRAAQRGSTAPPERSG